MKIFWGTTIFYLADTISIAETDANLKHIPVSSLDELKKEYNTIINSTKYKRVVFINDDIKKLKEWFMSMFTVIEAAGGLVLNNKKEFLFIFRKGKWDLPKGKIEKGESIETAAIREVEEECGINGLSIIKKIPPTYHIYLQDGKTILKPSYWFEMETSFTGMLIPQEQEGITKAEWVKKEEVAVLLPNAYESIQEVIGNYLQH